MAKASAANFNVVLTPEGLWTKWTRCGSCGHLLRWTDYLSTINPGQCYLTQCPKCLSPDQIEVDIPQEDFDEASCLGKVAEDNQNKNGGGPMTRPPGGAR